MDTTDTIKTTDQDSASVQTFSQSHLPRLLVPSLTLDFAADPLLREAILRFEEATRLYYAPEVGAGKSIGRKVNSSLRTTARAVEKGRKG